MRCYLLFAGLAFLVGPAWADPAHDVLRELTKCADIAAGSERLKCYDAAVPGAQTALNAAAPTSATAQTDRDSGGVLAWFGFSRPVTKPEDFGKPPAPVASEHDITSISANVTEFAKNPYGRALFILDNGQIWKEIDGDNTEVADFRDGEPIKVTIETGILGGYNLTIVGRTGIVKVRRVK